MVKAGLWKEAVENCHGCGSKNEVDSTEHSIPPLVGGMASVQIVVHEMNPVVPARVVDGQ